MKFYSKKYKEIKISNNFKTYQVRICFHGRHFESDPKKKDFELQLVLFNDKKYAREKWEVLDLNDIINKEELFNIPYFAETYRSIKDNPNTYFGGLNFYFEKNPEPEFLQFLFDNFEKELSDEKRLILEVS